MVRTVCRVVGAVFVLASLPKFLAYGWELENFRRFGLPGAPAWVIAAGVLELVGGVLLLRGRLVVPVALVLCVVMGVAIGTSGIAQGDVVPSLTLAPALLLALLWLLARELLPRAEVRRPRPGGRGHPTCRSTPGA